LGGTTDVTFSVVAGDLPPGILLTPRGRLVGSPKTEGSFTFTVRATDAEHHRGQKELLLPVTRHHWIAPYSQLSGSSVIMNTSWAHATVLGPARVSGYHTDTILDYAGTVYDLSGLTLVKAFDQPPGHVFLDTPDGAWLNDVTDTTKRVLMAPRNHPEQASYLSDSAWTSFDWGYQGLGSSGFLAAGVTDGKLYIVDGTGPLLSKRPLPGTACTNILWNGSVLAYSCDEGAFVIDADLSDNLEPAAASDGEPRLVQAFPQGQQHFQPVFAWLAPNLLSYQKDEDTFSVAHMDGPHVLQRCDVAAPVGWTGFHPQLVDAGLLSLTDPDVDGVKQYVDLESCTRFDYDQGKLGYPRFGYYSRQRGEDSDVYHLQTPEGAPLFTSKEIGEISPSPDRAIIARWSGGEFPHHTTFHYLTGSPTAQRIDIEGGFGYSPQSDFALFYSVQCAGCDYSQPRIVPLDRTTTTPLVAPGATGGTFDTLLTRDFTFLAYSATDKIRVARMTSAGFTDQRDLADAVRVDPTVPSAALSGSATWLGDHDFLIFEADAPGAPDYDRQLLVFDTMTHELKQVGPTFPAPSHPDYLIIYYH